MMQQAFDILAIFFLLFGLFFMLVGAVGVVRLPDIYHRLHAASKCSTLGLLGLLLAAMCHVGTLPVVTKSLAVIAFAFVATPVGSHILAKAAHRDKAKAWDGTLSDELTDCEADGACNLDHAEDGDDTPRSKKKRKHRAA